MWMFKNQYYGDYVSRVRRAPMRVLPYNKGAAAVVIELGRNNHGIRSAARVALIGQLLLWLPRWVDMQGCRRGQTGSSENTAFDVFSYTGVFKRVWVGRSEIEKSVCIDVLLMPYYDSINAATISYHAEAIPSQEKSSLSHIALLESLSTSLLSLAAPANMSFRTVAIRFPISPIQATSAL
jgi:hypothetical protein